MKRFVKYLFPLAILSVMAMVFPKYAYAATTTLFMEPGGDADGLVGTTNGFWAAGSSGTVVTDFVHGTHVDSIKYAPGTAQKNIVSTILPKAGFRFSFYMYVNVLPNATTNFVNLTSTGFADYFNLRMTSAGVIQVWNGTTAQVGSNAGTLSTGKWYRISVAATASSNTVNEVKVFINGALSTDVVNATYGAVNNSDDFNLGNSNTNATFDFRSSDHYIDNSTSLTDTGDVWVTAKRPNANGTTNGFSTQIGAGGSGYGSGHSPQVNERPLSTTNGWSMIGVGSPVTEEYNVENSSTGDINITNSYSTTYSIVDTEGWVSASSLTGETIQIIVNGVSSSQAITSTQTLYKKIAGSTSRPSGSGADIGITTDTTLTTVSLYEAGVLIAFIPSPTQNHALVTQLTGIMTSKKGTVTIP